MKKRSCFCRRAAALLSALVLCFALTLPALADETLLEGTATIQFARSYEWAPSTFYVQNRYSIGSGGSGSSTGAVSDSSNDVAKFGWRTLSLPSELYPSGATCGLYFSSYYASSVGASQSKAPTKSDFSLQVKSTSTGGFTTLPVQSVSLFEPSSDYNSLSDGVTVVARYANAVSDPYSSVILYNGSADSTAPAWTFDATSSTFFSKYQLGYLFVTSFRVVSTSSSAELDSLESMASAIAAQSEVLSQFYGDIVAVCNQIYQRLGDMQQTQEEANQLFSSMISLLNTTNTKITSLNQAMSTYFELVLKSLANESLSIQDCIDDAEARLELYLKPMIDYFTELEEQTGESAATLPQHKTDIDGFDNQGYGIDGDGQAGLAALVPIFGAFTWIFSVIGIFIGVGIINLLVKKGMS